MTGNFKNAGQTRCKTAGPVPAHDWPQDAIGQAVPCGVYDVNASRGYVCAGDCFDVPRFAVEAIANWRSGEGCKR